MGMQDSVNQCQICVGDVSVSVSSSEEDLDTVVSAAHQELQWAASQDVGLEFVYNPFDPPKE